MIKVVCTAFSVQKNIGRIRVEEGEKNTTILGVLGFNVTVSHHECQLTCLPHRDTY